jgi:hypothetical protein
MADVPITPTVPATTEPDPNSWAASVAGKKVLWGVGKVVAALIASPVAAHAFQTFSDTLKPYGVTIMIDPAILSKALPPLIFAGLVLAHDYAKVKYPDITWL